MEYSESLPQPKEIVRYPNETYNARGFETFTNEELLERKTYRNLWLGPTDSGKFEWQYGA